VAKELRIYSALLSAYDIVSAFDEVLEKMLLVPSDDAWSEKFILLIYAKPGKSLNGSSYYLRNKSFF